VLALGVLLALVVSLLLLGLRVHAMSKANAAFERWLSGLVAANPEAALVDAVAFENAKASLKSPFVLAQPGLTNGVPWMFVPETRFNCRECRHPVAIEATVCPFCKIDVLPPEKITLDHDNDGMPTDWERRYGLDSADASDAQKDLDGDGYANLQEFVAGTDPSDPGSPEAVERLRLDRITEVPFAIRFNSRVRNADGGYKFGLNYRLKGQTQTDFVEIGQTIAGYKVEKYEEKVVPAVPPKMSREDQSELTLVSPKGVAIVLVKDRPVSNPELTAHLSISLRGTEVPYVVQQGDRLEVVGKAYTVIGIDGKAQHVIIKNEITGEQRTIRQVNVVEQAEKHFE